MNKLMTPRRLAVVLPALLVLTFATGCASIAAKAPADGGITDARILDVLQRVARHQIQPLADGDYSPVTSVAAAAAAPAPGGLNWGYPWGVDLYGMQRSTDITGDPAVDKFVTSHNQTCARYYAWLAGLNHSVTNPADLPDFIRTVKIKNLVTLGSLDSCGAMGTELAENLLRHPEAATPGEKQVLERVADWVIHRQSRLPDGTLWRPTVQGGTLWPDDLYMGGAFLDRYSAYTHDPQYARDAANQIIHQAALEQDADGLWYHGYFVKEKRPAPYKWGRGNGWVTVTLVETLSVLPENDPLRAPVLDILRRQVEGLKKVQAADGMWRQVLDKPELWEETSCTAMFAYGIARAVNRGWLDATNLVVARHAFAAVAAKITPAGVINGTCIGTSIDRTLEYYVKRQQPVDDPHGRGPVLLAGTELLLAAKK